MACCPEGSLGQLGTEGYVDKVKLTLNWTTCTLYTLLGPGGEGGGPGAVLCGVWGQVYHLELRHLWLRFRSDKVRNLAQENNFEWSVDRQTADLFAEAGYLVVMPDFYRGTWKDPTSPDVVQFIKEKTQWSKLKLDLENIVLPFAKSKGALWLR